MPVIGIIRDNLANGSEGLAIAYGKASGVDTSTFSVGDTVYVSASTAGALTNEKPTGATNLIQNVGIVVKDAANGIIKVTGIGRANDIPNIGSGKIWIGNATGVAVETGYKYPVTATGATSGDVLVYNSDNNALSFKSAFSTFMESAYDYADAAGYGNLGALPGDINNDGNITTADLLEFLGLFGTSIVDNDNTQIVFSGMNSPITLTESISGFAPSVATGPSQGNKLDIDNAGAETDWNPVSWTQSTAQDKVALTTSEDAFTTYFIDGRLRINGEIKVQPASADLAVYALFAHIQRTYNSEPASDSFFQCSQNFTTNSTDEIVVAFDNTNVVANGFPGDDGGPASYLPVSGTTAPFEYPQSFSITLYIVKASSQDGSETTATLTDLTIKVVG